MRQPATAKATSAAIAMDAEPADLRVAAGGTPARVKMLLEPLEDGVDPVGERS